MKKYFLLMMAAVASFPVLAEKVIRLDGISIRGNSEEPNVVYVTPWQPAPGTGRLFEPVSSYREHWFKPVSRESFKRETEYLNYFRQPGSASLANTEK